MTPSDTPSSSDINIMSVFIAAGADPDRLARWMRENTDTQTPVHALATAGEALRAQHRR
ncbi:MULTISPECIES: hypothetical protein [Mycolicibacterium]|uniref:hypothetical protein n=1 Tax=Mycolicibacterium TaxID=1866885 RepID=UPI000A7C417A|nr:MULTISPECIES: hypothetical protein [Mycolicibacterium]WGI35904.1 hypothetical protein QDT91_27830 [Mycolicibacterium aubagnense]